MPLFNFVGSLSVIPLRSPGFRLQQMDANYHFRGPLLQAWPWYFYVAGIDRVCLPRSEGYLFEDSHPQYSTHCQYLHRTTAWRVPILVGPPISSRAEDAETRAAILLLLFRPWHGTVESVLRDEQAPSGCAASCVDAWGAYSRQLSALDHASRKTTRPESFTEVYWARRILHVVRNIDNWTAPTTGTANAGVRENPEAAMGVSNTTEISLGPGVFLAAEADLDSCSSCADQDHDEESDPDAHADIMPGEDRSKALLLVSPDLVLDTASVDVPSSLGSRSLRSLQTYFPLRRGLLPESSGNDLRPPACTVASRRVLKQAWSEWGDVELQFDSASAADTAVFEANVQRPSVIICDTHPIEILQAAWTNIRNGLCRQLDGRLNIKQAAYHLLFALRLAALVNPASGQQAPSPCALLGGPGTGKTHMLNLNAQLMERFLPGAAVSCAFMNSAARLIKGTTLHAEFGMGLDGRQQTSTTALRSLTQRWQHKRILRIDEISMVSAELLARTESTARTAKQKLFRPWGDLLVDLSGDIQQLPPVRQRSILADPRPAPASSSITRSDTSPPDPQLAERGRELWLDVKSVIFLNYSRRCSGPLADVLRDMRDSTTLSDASWNALQQRLLSHPNATAARAQVRAGMFSDRSCRAGVLRHDVRVSLCRHRELQHATTAGSPLFVSVAADRCIEKSCPGALTQKDYLNILRISSLTTTKQLQGFLFLYVGMTVVLEERLSQKLQLVRGCPCKIAQILFDIREPDTDQAPPGEFHVLQFVPEALLLRVEDVAWKKHPILEPGCFYLPARRRSWTTSLPGSATTTVSVERLQLPVTNDAAATAYNLQGQTIPRGIFALSAPDNMSRDELWISLYVLLSRPPSLEDTVFLDLPKRASFEGGPPAFLKAEMHRLRALETTTLQQLHSELGKWGMHEAAAAIEALL